jgi:hypothetical protein
MRTDLFVPPRGIKWTKVGINIAAAMLIVVALIAAPKLMNQAPGPLVDHPLVQGGNLP